MHKIMRRLSVFFLLAWALTITVMPGAWAAADRQSFWGFGPGIEVLSNNGSGSGFYISGFGGYNFDSIIGMGLHVGYSNVGTIAIQAWDFGVFGQFTEPDSGLYGRFYLSGVNFSASSGNSTHGVIGSQFGVAPGIGLGMLIPSAGDFHLVPEVTYRMAFLNNMVNMVTMTFSAMWDF